MTSVGPLLAVFLFADSRSSEAAEKFLRNYCGTIVRDMDSGYLKIPSSPLAEAVNYALNHRPALEKFLHDPRIDIGNNPADNIIRPIAPGRKNRLFAGSEDAGQNFAILASFAAFSRLEISISIPSNAGSSTISPWKETFEVPFRVTS